MLKEFYIASFYFCEGMIFMDQNVSERIFARIDSYRDEAVKIQSELTAIPALSPSSGGEGEWRKALKLKEYMDAVGYDSFEEYNAPCPALKEGTRPNHVYRFKGLDSSRTVWIMSHLDIVPPGDLKLWNTDPYAVKEEGDVLYGRGVEDNQQGIVSSLLAVRALREEKIAPKYDVALLFISDEETGSFDGIQYVLKMKPDLFSKDDLIYVPDSGVPDGSRIEVAEKSIMWLKFTTKGMQAHASRPQCGINAFKAASNLVVRLQALYEIFGGRNEIFEPPTSTFEPTKKEANVPNVNSIPGEDVFYLDCRVLPVYELEKVFEEVRRIADGVERDFGVKVLIDFAQREQAAPETSPDSDVVRLCAAAVRDVYRVEPRACGIGGGTVAAHIRRLGYPAVVWSRLNDTAHQANEHCLVSNVLGDAKVFAHIAAL